MEKVEEGQVVRARRFELVDDHDRVRAVLGFGEVFPNDPYSGAAGLELYDNEGSCRAWIADTDEAGVSMGLVVGGNEVVIIRAAEPGGERDAGAAVALCSLDGAPVLQWRVDVLGSVSSRGDSRQ